jgi:anti-anti-sigma regulatory factor
MPHMRFRRPAGSRAADIVVSGHPNAAAVQRLDTALQRAAQASETVVLDLRGLAALDLATAWPIVRADLHIRAAGGRLVLLGGAPVRRLFAQLGLDGVLQLVDHPAGSAGEARPLPR